MVLYLTQTAHSGTQPKQLPDPGIRRQRRIQIFPSHLPVSYTHLKAIKSKVKTYVKKVETAVEKKDVEAAKAALKEAISVINKAGSKGVYHKNTCARKISRLTKAVNEIA